MSDQVATLRAEEEQVGLRFERRYDATPDEVWAALTEPESIRRWLLAEAVLEPRVGGAFSLDWSADDRADGTVRASEPPRILEADWPAQPAHPPGGIASDALAHEGPA